MMDDPTLNDLDRRLVIATQAGLPLTPAPYATLAEQLGMAETEVLARLQAMLDSGVIRRIGAVPNHYAIGYIANGMSVWDVADEFVDAIGERVGGLDFVTHCYRRPRHLPGWHYNLFAMVHGRNPQFVLEQVDAVADLMEREFPGACRGHDVLFSTEILKKTGLRLGA